MSIKDWIKNLVKGSALGCSWNYDAEGINFIFTEKQRALLSNSKADDYLMYQHIALRMLVEQGDAEDLPNGVFIPSSVAVELDENTHLLLTLPNTWQGRLNANIKGRTSRSSFQVDLTAANEGNVLTHGFSVEGAIIRFSSEKCYLLSPYHLRIFTQQQKHKLSHKTEYDNLSLVLVLQKAQEMGAKVSLGHFEKLNILAPESITIEAELDQHHRLILTPQMGQAASHERIQKVLGKFSNDMATALRVDNEIILFDEKRLTVIHEILRNRVIAKENVSKFLKNPTAFIDASLVDLDLGFSARVKGAIRFKHAYFGETDESGIDWFGKKFTTAGIFSPKKLAEFISDSTQLDEFRNEFKQAQKTNAQEIEFEENTFDISNIERVNAVLTEIEENLSGTSNPEFIDEESVDLENADKEIEGDQDTEPAVVDIELNDDDLNTHSKTLDLAIQEVLVDEKSLDWKHYLRQPYLHQILGVRWILGLALNVRGLGGGILADDMGLGKTFMSLASMDHLYRICRSQETTEKPCLVVAPLSLLQNWKDEVEQTFKISPFNDIVILQSNAQLYDFKVGGNETKNQTLSEDEEAVIRYSLKVGSKFVNERLDLPKRLVITTYQTLRDYQFSLCSVDWGMVVFDEAQNIKNPNALQTRAAKGIKADFRLIATGTPVENSLADFWCLMDTACPRLLSSYQLFRDDYITPILRAAGDEVEHVRGVTGRRLRERVGAFMLRRVKEDCLEGLPNKNIFVGIDDSNGKYLPALHSTLSHGQLESYDEILSSTANSENNMVLTALQRLRDVSLHPKLVFGGGLDTFKHSSDLTALMKESGKFQSMLSILNDIQQRQEKCIIFTINKKLQHFLSLTLRKTYSLPFVSIINGDTKAIAKRVNSPTRKSIISDFEKKDGFNIIIMSPVAAGVGLTVVGANNVMHLERHWNPAKEAQATDRVYRIGQKREVNVFIPLIHHPHIQSFDVNLHQLLAKKSLLKDAVITPEQVLPSPEGFNQGNCSPSQRLFFNEVKSLSWQQFEALCAELLSKEYQSDNCWLTHDGGDYGADVVLVKDNRLILIQCKHTSSQTYNGYSAVTEVQAAKIKYEAELGQQVTSLVFATNAVRLGSKTRKTAKQYSVNIFDGKALSKMLEIHAIQFIDILQRLDKKRLQV